MAIVLHIYFRVEASSCAEFEAMYTARYVPALRKQSGYRQSRLLRLYDARTSAEIAAAPTPFNYQMELEFTTEDARRAWVKSPEHAEAWPLASALAAAAEWRGYDVIDADRSTLERSEAK